MDAGPQGEGGVSVAQVVQADAGERELLDQAIEALRDVVRVQRAPVLLGEDKAAVAPRGAPREPLSRLAGLVGPQGREREGIEGDHSAALGRLRRRELHLVADGDERLPDRDAAPIEVDV
jgi:hypothetical protein